MFPDEKKRGIAGRNAPTAASFATKERRVVAMAQTPVLGLKLALSTGDGR
jgi:hypothetical protein